jgi:hypothetical protein
LSPGFEASAHLASAAAGLERRAVLQLFGMAAAGLLPGGCGGGPSWLAPPPGPPLAVLTPRAYATFTAAAARLVGPTGADPHRSAPARRRPHGRRPARPLARARGPLGQALLVLEFGVRPVLAKWRPFTALDGAAQDAVLEDLVRSRFDLKRQIFAGVRAMALLAFYGLDASRAVSGYPGPFGSDAVPIGAGLAG